MSSSHHPPIDQSSQSPTTSSKGAKLRKIPPIPFRRSNVKGDQEDDSGPSMLVASSLGLNHIKTRPSLSPLRFSSSVEAEVSSILNDGDVVENGTIKDDEESPERGQFLNY